MTVMLHTTPEAVPRDARCVIVYYDTEGPSLDTLTALGNTPHVRGIPVDTPHADLPARLRPYLPAPPRDDMAWPLVVAVYDGDVVSWVGHDPTALDAWVVAPDRVASYLTRSAHRTQAIDRGDVTSWDIPTDHLGRRAPTT